MSTLLVVHHAPTDGVRRLLDAVVAGANDDAIEGVDVRVVPALEPDADAVLAADGYVLVTPANFGYMSGALGHNRTVRHDAMVDHAPDVRMDTTGLARVKAVRCV